MAKDNEKENKETKETGRYVVQQVATQTEDVIVDKNNNKTYGVIDFLAMLGNKIEELKKAL